MKAHTYFLSTFLIAFTVIVAVGVFLANFSPVKAATCVFTTKEIAYGAPAPTLYDSQPACETVLIGETGGIGALTNCTSQCDAPNGCSCPSSCGSNYVPMGKACGEDLSALPTVSSCETTCTNPNGCVCPDNCLKTATANNTSCGEGTSVTDTYCGLSATQFRQLTQSCVNGIDCANQRCLPSAGTTNGSLNLGAGSRCQYGSQCASPLICSTSGVCVSQLEPGETAKPTGDANATYQPTGEVILTGYGSDVTLKDPDNEGNITGVACTDNYDCALGYHCSSNRTCQKDTFNCTSDAQCPANYSCVSGACQADFTKTGEERDVTSSTGGTGGTGTGQCQIADGRCDSSCNCCSVGTECLAIHKCDPSQGADVICVNLAPEVRQGGQCVDAQALANQTCSCIQVDILNGTNNSCVNGHYNGGDPYAISEGATVACPTDTSNCTTTPVPPPPGQTPPPQTPPPGPQCLNITISENQPQLGQQVTFTCGEVAGAARYVFRVQHPNGAVDVLNATGRVSQPLTVANAGTYSAQCQICTGSDDSTCHPFEYLPQR